MFTRLRNRLLLLNMTIISIVMIIAFTVIYFITYSHIQNENKNKLESIPRILHVAPVIPNLNNEESIPLRIPVGYIQSFAIWVNEDGELKQVSSFLDLPKENYEQIAEKTWQMKKNEGTISLENRKWHYRILPMDHKKVLIDREQRRIYSNDLHQIVFLDITDSSKTLTQLLITFVLVGFAMLFILFGVSFFFANRSIRPVEESWKKQKQFVADASHELKTPLAIINATSDALRSNGEETVNSQKKWLDYIQAETSRMGKLVNDMLYLAKAEDSFDNQIPFDISQTVAEIIASMEVVMFEKGIHLTQSIEPELLVEGDGQKIKQAILILLDNATKYTNENGHVSITLKNVKNHVVFSIQNSGKGIPAEKLSRIFDRFFRGDPSRSQETSGYGLGLSIAKAIIERSKGTIYAESKENSTTFTFELKRYMMPEKSSVEI